MDRNSIFDYVGDVHVVVNPTNTAGVMGAGLAKQFKDRYPEMFLDYKQACKDKTHCIGKNHYWGMNGYSGMNIPTVICNLATKEHWINKSKYYYVGEGLIDLKRYMNANNLKTVAIPKLGCGLGGLDWDVVNTIIDEVFTPDKENPLQILVVKVEV